MDPNLFDPRALAEWWSLTDFRYIVITDNVGTAWYSNNKPPVFDGLYQLSMVIWEMVYFCYTHIIEEWFIFGIYSSFSMVVVYII